MVKVTVKSVGRGRKMPLAERVEIENLTSVVTLQEQAFVEMTVAGTD